MSVMLFASLTGAAMMLVVHMMLVMHMVLMIHVMFMMHVTIWLVRLYHLWLWMSNLNGLGDSGRDNLSTIRLHRCGCYRCRSRPTYLTLHTRLCIVNWLCERLCHTCVCSNNCDCYQAKYILFHNCILLMLSSELSLISEGKITAKYLIFKGSFPNLTSFFPNIG
jgi:hypothetical protein